MGKVTNPLTFFKQFYTLSPMKKQTFRDLDDPYGDDFTNGYTGCRRTPNWSIQDKTTEFRTWMHYSDPDAGKEITVFGSAKPGLFYNYSDRLLGDDWRIGEELAKKVSKPKTAKWFEIILNQFHHTDDVNLQHVILGVNRSNGYSYLIFGYTYTEKNLSEKG